MPEALTRRRANELDGRTWQRYSISVWSDIRKTPEEMRLRHPAMFPAQLVGRLIRCFSGAGDRVVLDPFAGTGATPAAAEALGKVGVGVELSAEFCEVARARPTPDLGGDPSAGRRMVHQGDARRLLVDGLVTPASVDLVITSPPYWNILLQRRTADGKPRRDYGLEEADIGKIVEYGNFLQALRDVFQQVYTALRPGKYCIVVVMDLRKKDRFYPLHADLARLMESIGFVFDDLIIWDRRHEYNHMRPLGYPYRFRINKAHEYILIFLKPRAS